MTTWAPLPGTGTFTRGCESIHLLNSASWSGSIVSVGGVYTSPAVVTVCSSARGKKATSDTDPTMNSSARTASAGVLTTDRTSVESRPGSLLSAIEVPPDTRKIPITATYIVMQIGHAFPMTKNEA